jgi:hypothetical protein
MCNVSLWLSRSSCRNVLVLTRLSSGGLAVHQIFEGLPEEEKTPKDTLDDENSGFLKRQLGPPLFLVMGIDYKPGSHYNPAFEINFDPLSYMDLDQETLSQGQSQKLDGLYQGLKADLSSNIIFENKEVHKEVSPIAAMATSLAATVLDSLPSAAWKGWADEAAGPAMEGDEDDENTSQASNTSPAKL